MGDQNIELSSHRSKMEPKDVFQTLKSIKVGNEKLKRIFLCCKNERKLSICKQEPQGGNVLDIASGSICGHLLDFGFIENWTYYHLNMNHYIQFTVLNIVNIFKAHGFQHLYTITKRVRNISL